MFRDVADNAAAPIANCKKYLRGSFIDFSQLPRAMNV
jgi:hypothetical protein